MRFEFGIVLAVLIAVNGSRTDAAELLVPSQYPTIQAAIDAAATTGDHVVVADGSYSGPGFVDLVTYGKAITIRSAGGIWKCYIQLNGNRAFYLNGGNYSPTIEGLNFSNGGAVPSDQGGANGGFIYVSTSSPIIRDCYFWHGDTIAGDGGAIYVNNGNPKIENCQFHGNGASRGGAIYANAIGFGTTIDGCLFAGNTASIHGGGIYSTNTYLTVKNCTFDANDSNSPFNPDGGGGGMYQSGSTAFLTNCTFTNNDAVRSGGGFYCINANYTQFTDCTFEGNHANGEYEAGGGGLFARDSEISVNSCTFSNNSSAGTDYGTGGGGAMFIGGSPIVYDCSFQGCTTGTYGGGLYAFESNAFVEQCQFNANHASGSGGGAMNDHGTATIQNCDFTANTAGSYGRGYYDDHGLSILVSCTFANHNALTMELFSSSGFSGLFNCTFDSSGGTGLRFYETNQNAGGPIVDSCTFTNNLGRAVIFYDSEGSIVDSSFESNSGGGIDVQGQSNVDALAIISGCSFIGNGALTSNPQFPTLGGAIRAGNEDAVDISGCYFEANIANFGGAIYAQNYGEFVNLNDCTFNGNLGANGSAIYATEDWFILGGSGGKNLDEVVNLATLEIGSPYIADPTHVTIFNGYRQFASGSGGQTINGELNIDLGGTALGNFDRMTLNGNAALAGRLNVGFVENYKPADGDQFEIISAAGISSVFDIAVFPPVPDGLFMSLLYAMGSPLAGSNGAVTIVIDDLNAIIAFDLLVGVPPDDISNFTDVAIGDFDGANGDDLAITISTGPATPGSVLVLLNDGTGTKFAGTQYNVGNDPSAVIVGLFSADVALDLAVANRGSDTVTILANNGSGAFTPLGSPLSVGDQPIALAAANVDSPSQGQGEIDLLICNFASDTITLLKNLGAGLFAAPLTLPAADEPISIDPADVEGDRGPGLPDFVVANRNSENVGVYRNLGGTFAAPVFFAVGGPPVDVRAEDLNADGQDEILTTNALKDLPPEETDIPSQFALLRNIGSGLPAFANVQHFYAEGDYLALTTVNIDSDNDLDVALLRNLDGQSEIVIVRNDTQGFGSTIIFPQVPDVEVVGSGAKTIVVGNIDNEGAVDLLAPNNGGGPLAGGSQTLGIIVNQTALLCPDIAPAGGGNGAVDVDDLLALINTWGPCAACSTDIVPPGGDGVVNVDDLLAIINGWGPCE